MKVVVLIVAFLIAATGLVFFLQGINILPGSYMTGDPKWAYIGGAMLVIGAGIIVLTLRNRQGSAKA